MACLLTIVTCILLMLLPMMVAAGSGRQDPKCHTTCTDEISEYYNVNNCTLYTLCYGGTTYEKVCDDPANAFFDGHSCTPDQSKCCNAQMQSTPPSASTTTISTITATTPTATFSTTTTPTVNKCHYSCQGNPSKFADPGNCSLYVLCYNGVEYTQYCEGPTPFFDGVECTYDLSNCCTGSTTSIPPIITVPTTTTTPATTTVPTTTTTTPTTTIPTTTTPPTTTVTTTTTPITSSLPMDCLPSPDCSLLPSGSYVADPHNCHQFYICLPDATIYDVVFSCDDNYFFHPVAQECQPVVPCLPACCPLTCSDNDRVFDHHNCKNYYYCYENEALQMECHGYDTQYFNGINCVGDEASCCTRPCQPYCSRKGSWLPHPTDCRSYYFCTQLGTPTPDTQFTCPQGYNYDYKLNRCSTTAPCDTLC